MNELKYKMKSSKLCWPGDEGEERWNQAWQAIKKVSFHNASAAFIYDNI